ncbi:hypothetical protein C8D92_105266 [Tamilnaduibacter salinus]|uniref:YecA family protein n=2 Tax=Tamilnaduibacter salinus TaxID=1484056 RepID=A0A2U1CWY6_9GAMM|nr:hypothetical protein C8D92_105266 [Tamilnaduibacter salinus]
MGPHSTTGSTPIPMTEHDAPTVPANDFETWANHYAAHRAFSHPSELHGGLCGRLAAGARLDADEWLDVASEQIGVAPEAIQSASDLKQFLSDVYDQTLSGLQAHDMTFQPVLPDDDHALDQRLQALSAWVRGFLEGMAVCASQELGEASGEIREIVEDMVAISQVADGEDDSEEGELQLLELIEYVRVGAMTIFIEFNPSAPPPSPDATLH